MSASRPAATVAVCTRGRGDRVVATLVSIAANRDVDLELLVVDQSDDDETARAVGSLDLDVPVRLVRTATRGIGRSRALAVEEARAESVLFTDDDCTVPPDWVSSMVALLDEHPGSGMAFCNVLAAPHDDRLGFVPTYERAGTHLARSPWHKRTARGIGAGMAVRRDAAIAVGNFDHTLPACEEGDLALRLILAGHDVVESDRTAVVHDGFRRWDQGPDLARRNWLGIGLAAAKPLRAGRWRAVSFVVHEGVLVALVGPLASILMGQRPRLRGFVWFWRGFAQGLRRPVDPDTLTFAD